MHAKNRGRADEAREGSVVNRQSRSRRAEESDALPRGETRPPTDTAHQQRRGNSAEHGCEELARNRQCRQALILCQHEPYQRRDGRHERGTAHCQRLTEC